MGHGVVRVKKWVACITLALIAANASAQVDVFDALRDDGHVLLLRHAIAPGFGDPDEFDINDCATQRNLSAQGRQQARAIGDQLRAEGLGDIAVYTSYWCRGRDTANAMNLTQPQPHPGLNSFFQDRGQRDAIINALRDLLKTLANEPPAVLVTHQVNIRAVTGQGVRSGGGVVVKLDAQGATQVVGRFSAPTPE